MNINEIAEIVDKLNTDIVETFYKNEDTQKLYEEYSINVSLISNGDIVIIEFCGIHIWNSEDDERPHIDEENDEKEPLLQYLQKEIETICNMFKLLEF